MNNAEFPVKPYKSSRINFDKEKCVDSVNPKPLVSDFVLSWVKLVKQFKKRLINLLRPYAANICSELF